MMSSFLCCCKKRPNAHAHAQMETVDESPMHGDAKASPPRRPSAATEAAQHDRRPELTAGLSADDAAARISSSHVGSMRTLHAGDNAAAPRQTPPAPAPPPRPPPRLEMEEGSDDEQTVAFDGGQRRPEEDAKTSPPRGPSTRGQASRPSSRALRSKESDARGLTAASPATKPRGDDGDGVIVAIAKSPISTPPPDEDAAAASPISDAVGRGDLDEVSNDVSHQDLEH